MGNQILDGLFVETNQKYKRIKENKWENTIRYIYPYSFYTNTKHRIIEDKRTRKNKEQMGNMKVEMTLNDGVRYNNNHHNEDNEKNNLSYFSPHSSFASTSDSSSESSNHENEKSRNYG